ncbi:hypothetical protein GCM10027612_71330 [Microbispora bryophytorum subsp. camponoti]
MLIASGRAAALADPIAARLPVVLRHEEVVMHVPAEVADRARTAAEAAEADVVVTVGGGRPPGWARPSP